MSIARIQTQFGLPPQNKAVSISMKFNMSVELSKTLEKVKQKNDVSTLANNADVSLNDLQVSYQHINELLANKKLKDDDKVALEHYKTCIMQSTLLYLERLNYSANKNKNLKEEKTSRIWRGVKIGFLVLVSLIGLVEGGIDGFLGTNQLLLQLIPQISNVWLIAVTLAITAINVILFVAFEVDLLKNLLGVTHSGNATKILQAHETQIDLTNKINSKLAEAHTLTKLTILQYKELANVTAEFNQDIESKRPLYKECKEHPVLKGLRWLLTGLGAMMCALGSYWGAASLLATIAAPLVGTPVGWIIVGALVASGLVFYFAMQGNGMTNLFNSTLSAFNKVKEKLDPFVPKSKNDFNNMLLHRNIFKKEVTPPLVTALDLGHVSTKRKSLNHAFFAKKETRLISALTDYDYSANRRVSRSNNNNN